MLKSFFDLKPGQERSGIFRHNANITEINQKNENLQNDQYKNKKTKKLNSKTIKNQFFKNP